MAANAKADPNLLRPKGGFHIIFYKQRFRVATNPIFVEYKAKLKYITGSHIIWEHDGSLESFRVLHKLARLSKMIPDKVDRAYRINCQSKQRDDDDTFLMNLLIIILMQCKDELKEQQNPEDLMIFETTNLSEQTTVGHFLQNKTDNINMHHVIRYMMEIIRQHIQSLKDKDQEQILQTADSLRRYATDIGFFFHVYDTLVHPTILENIRQGV